MRNVSFEERLYVRPKICRGPTFTNEMSPKQKYYYEKSHERYDLWLEGAPGFCEEDDKTNQLWQKMRNQCAGIDKIKMEVLKENIRTVKVKLKKSDFNKISTIIDSSEL